MGAKGIRIEEPCDVREGLAVALAHQGSPVVVDVVVDPALVVAVASSLPCGQRLHPQPRKTGIERENGIGDQGDRTQYRVGLIHRRRVPTMAWRVHQTVAHCSERSEESSRRQINESEKHRSLWKMAINRFEK
jgi:hypothetical protein